jgi:hypothetical protein
MKMEGLSSIILLFYQQFWAFVLIAKKKLTGSRYFLGPTKNIAPAGVRCVSWLAPARKN